MADINRLKLVLVEKKKTSKWLADELGVIPSTVSKWCTNSSQPDLARLLKIAELLEVDIRELIVNEYDAYLREKMKRNNNEQELYGHNITDRRSHGLRQERGS